MSTGNGRVIAAVALIAIGSFTFVQPLIGTDPPVTGRARWSLMDVAHLCYEGKLPGDADNIDLWILSGDFALIYALLILSAASLCFFPQQRVLLWSGIIGAIAALETMRAGPQMNSLFYGKPMLYGRHTSGHVSYGNLALALFMTMILSFLCALKATGASRQGKPRPRWRLKAIKRETREDDESTVID